MHAGPARTIETVPFTIVACLALILGALALVLDGDGAGDGERPAQPALRAAALGAIVELVERERGLTFERVPEPVAVTPALARREGLESLDADYPPARRARMRRS